MNEFFLLLFELFIKLWLSIEQIITPLLNLIINGGEFAITGLINLVEFIFSILGKIVGILKNIISFFT